MKQETLDWFENIDASIFSGDQFDEDLTAIQEAREYVERWDRELKKKANFAFNQKCIRHRIQCEGYPIDQDSLFASIAEFEARTGLKFKEQY